MNDETKLTTAERDELERQGRGDALRLVARIRGWQAGLTQAGWGGPVTDHDALMAMQADALYRQAVALDRLGDHFTDMVGTGGGMLCEVFSASENPVEVKVQDP